MGGVAVSWLGNARGLLEACTPLRVYAPHLCTSFLHLVISIADSTDKSLVPAVADDTVRLTAEQVVLLLYQAAESYLACLQTRKPLRARLWALQDLPALCHDFFLQESVVSHAVLAQALADVQKKCEDHPEPLQLRMLVEAHSQYWLERLLALLYHGTVGELKVLCLLCVVPALLQSVKITCFKTLYLKGIGPSLSHTRVTGEKGVGECTAGH